MPSVSIIKTIPKQVILKFQKCVIMYKYWLVKLAISPYYYSLQSYGLEEARSMPSTISDKMMEARLKTDETDSIVAIITSKCYFAHSI